MLFDPKAFLEASVAGIPLVLFVLVLTMWLGDVFNAQGKQKMVISMVVGLVFGVAYQISLALPGSFAGWFAVVVYGLGLGLLASGSWDAGRVMLEKALSKVLSAVIDRTEIR